jgi:hypothetical protein
MIMVSVSFANNMNHYYNNKNNNMDHHYNNTDYSIDVGEPILQDTKNPELFNVSMKKELYKYGTFHFISVLGFYFFVAIVLFLLSLVFGLDVDWIGENTLNIFNENPDQNVINMSLWFIINLIMPLIFFIKHKSQGFFKQYLLFIGFWLIGFIIPFLYFDITEPSKGFNNNNETIGTALVFMYYFLQ